MQFLIRIIYNFCYLRLMPRNDTRLLTNRQSTAPQCAHQKRGTKQKGTACLKLRIQFLTLHSAFLILLGCGLDVEDPTPPNPPQWVPKSLPEEWPERGIDAHESGSIFLEWIVDIEDDIKTCYISRALQDEVTGLPQKFEVIAEIEMSGRQSLAFIDRDIDQSIAYSYRLQAEDYASNLSSYSDSMSYMLLPILTPEFMQPNDQYSVEKVTSLSWVYSYAIEMEDYTITVLTQYDSLIVRDLFAPSSYTGEREFWNIPDSIVLKSGVLYKWRLDLGAKYYSDMETAGSESPWAYFLFSSE